jgi:protocatechuate 3,4-dioxygenase beta subunit
MKRLLAVPILLAVIAALVLLSREETRHVGPVRQDAPPPPAARPGGAAPATIPPPSAVADTAIGGLVTSGGKPRSASVSVWAAVPRPEYTWPALVLRPSGNRLREADPPLLAVAAGEDGRFEVPGLAPGRYELIAETASGAYGSTEVDIPAPSARVAARIDVPPGDLVLSGRAVLADGGPWHGLVGVPGRRRFAPTAGDGGFRFGGLTAGEVRIVALVPGEWLVESPAVGLPRAGEFRFLVEPPGRTLAGRVLDVAGRPLAGATVFAEHDGGARLLTVGPDGRFEIVVTGTVLLEAKAEGRRPESRMVPPSETTTEIRLLAAGRVTGTVRRAGDGAPTPGVPVHLASAAGDHLETVADGGGRFEFPEAPPGETAVWAWGSGLLPAEVAEGREVPCSFAVRPGETLVVDLAVRPAAGVEGVVLDPSDSPMPGAVVHLEEDSGLPFLFDPFFGAPGCRNIANRTAVAGAGGSFAVRDLIPGCGYLVRAEAPGFSPAVGKPFAAGASGPLTLRLAPERFVVVHARDARTGDPIAGTSVSASREDSDFRARATTDADGNAVLGPVPEGELALEGWAADYDGDKAWRVIGDGEDSAVVLSLRRSPAGGASGDSPDRDGVSFVRLLDPQGRPVPVACAWVWHVDGYFRASPTSDGEVALSTLICLGVIEVFRARDRDGSLLGAAVGEFRSGRDDVLTLRLPPPGVVEGVVRDPAGAPLPGVVVTAERPCEEMGEWTRRTAIPSHGDCVSDAGGRFSISGLGEGNYQLRVASPPGFAAPDPVPVRAGEHGVEIRLLRSVSLRVTVLGPDGRAVAGARVQAHLSEGDSRIAVTDEEGVAEIPGVPEEPGECSLGVEGALWLRDGMMSAWEHVDLSSGREVVVHLPADPAVRGKVVDREGRLVAGARVVGRQRGVAEVLVDQASDHDGTFFLRPAREGPIFLSVRHGDAGPDETGIDRLEVAAGTRDLVLTIDRAPSLIASVTGADGRPLEGYAGPTADLGDGCYGVRGDRERVVFPGLSARVRYLLFVRTTDGGPGLVGAAGPVAGDAGEVVISLAPGRSITGRLVPPPDEDVAPSSVGVAARVCGRDIRGVVRDDFSFEVPGIPPGEYPVTATWDGYEGRLRARAGDPVEIRLARR